MELSKIKRFQSNSFYIIIPKELIKSKKIKKGDIFIFLNTDDPDKIIMVKYIPKELK